jgi:fumarylacetoacetate (FAA) hydrolase
MKLLTYDPGSGPRCGVLDGDAVVDVAALLGSSHPLRDVRALLDLEDSAVDRVGDALAGNVAAPRVALADVRLRSPVLQPPTVRDYIVYEEHATSQGTREIDEVWYRMPVFYFSNPLVIYGPDDTVPYPSASNQLDYELEIGCVVGRSGTDVPESEAFQYIAGFCIFNDWSARDLQFDEMTFGLGPAKGKDSASSLGPWMVTTDEMAPHIKDGRLDLKCQVRVNGDVWLKDSETANAYYTWGEIIERAAKDSRIAPGDVIGSGTVGGGSIREAIRKGYEAARWLEEGDVVELEVENIGMLRNSLSSKRNADAGYRYGPKNPTATPEPGTARDYRYQRSR